MKLRLVLTISILIALSLIAIIIIMYDFVWGLDFESLVNLIYSKFYNGVINNQLSVRDVQNATSSLPSNNTNSTIILNDSMDSGSPVSWIIAVSCGATIAVGLGIYLGCYLCGIEPYLATPATENIELPQVTS